MKKNPYTTRCVELSEVTVGLIQMAMASDPGENIEKARQNVVKAARNGAKIICLPELYYTRYFPQHPGTDASPLAETIPGDPRTYFLPSPASTRSSSSSRSSSGPPTAGSATQPR